MAISKLKTGVILIRLHNELVNMFTIKVFQGFNIIKT